MLRVSLLDANSQTLEAMPDRLRAALSDKANSLAAALLDKVWRKLSGGVLETRSGALARSIVSMVDDAGTGVAATVASYGNVKYAAIHEFGGVIPPHEILPNKAKALAFAAGGKQAFAARVRLPAVTMPERSYLRSSLAEMTDEIKGGMSAAVVEAMSKMLWKSR